MIYFAQTSTGSIKIGCTEDLEARLKQHVSTYGELALLKTMPGGFEEETSIHRRFKHLRFRGTEEFRPSPDLMEFIGKPLLVGANPDAVEKAAELRAVRLELPEDVHKLLRLEAAKQDTSLAALARVAVEEYLTRRKPGGK